MFKSTIVIPEKGHPHMLDVALRALIRNSAHKHKIVVLTSDPRAQGLGGVDIRDWYTIGGEPVVELTGTKEYAEDNAGWLAANSIEIVDVTDRCLRFRKSLERGVEFHGGHDIAYKNNYGLAVTDTEWTIPNWDADFFPGWRWDEPLFDFAGKAPPQVMLVPTHTQPKLVETIPSWSDPWRQAREGAQNRLAVPTTHGNSKFSYVTEQEFFDFCQRLRIPGGLRSERPGVRETLHWVPALVRTDEVLAAGGYSYQGPGYDLEFDDRLGRLGFTKWGFSDSFILHKGHVPPSDVSV